MHGCFDREVVFILDLEHRYTARARTREFAPWRQRIHNWTQPQDLRL